MRLDQLVGTDIAGALAITEAAINELLKSERSPAAGATISVEGDNQVVLRYGLLRARAALPRAIDVGDAPRVKVVLASVLVGLALSAAVRQPYIQVRGREVTLLLADIPALQSLRDVWPHVKAAGLRTEGTRVVMDFRFSVMK
jgi:hypothetical protein